MKKSFIIIGFYNKSRIAMCQNVRLEVFDGKNIGKIFLSTLTKMFDGCIVFNLIENTNLPLQRRGSPSS